MRKSIFGSVKDKLTRKPTNASQKSNSSTESNRQSRRGPFELESPTTVPMGIPPPPTNNNPFSNPSPATRRPAAMEPPPAYTETPTVQSGPAYAGVSGGSTARGVSPAPSHISAISVSTPEDPYAFLSSFDTIFVIDDSGSMAGRSWREVKEALRAIAPICTAHDKDGVDIYFLNHRSSTPADLKNGKAAGGYRGVSDDAAVERIFTSVRPGGATPTGTRLQHILKPYTDALTKKQDDMESIKPINVIVITDGVPSDDVESVLVTAAKKLDKIEAPPYQVGVQFFQVGNEPGAREALRELDDGITELVEGGVRDMVDTVTWSVKEGTNVVLTAESILKTVLGAVVRRIDRRRSGESRRNQNLRP